MTTENNTPAFYLFAQIDGQTRRVGAAFKHKKGSGFNLLLNGQRYTAFPPKSQPPKGRGA